jgi:hypothetical protein
MGIVELGIPINLKRTSESQIEEMLRLLRRHNKGRWNHIIGLRNRISTYLGKVRQGEQPLKRV